MNGQSYLLDASTLITPFHGGQLEALAKAFKQSSPDAARTCLEEWFERNLTSGVLRIDKSVEEEVLNLKEKGKPGVALLERLKGQYSLLQPNTNTQTILTQVGDFIRAHFEPHQEVVFFKKADPILVALAKDYGLTLVTEEKHFLPEGNGKTGKLKGEPRLPFVAFAFGVRCISLMTALVEVP